MSIKSPYLENRWEYVRTLIFFTIHFYAASKVPFSHIRPCNSWTVSDRERENFLQWTCNNKTSNTRCDIPSHLRFLSRQAPSHFGPALDDFFTLRTNPMWFSRYGEWTGTLWKPCTSILVHAIMWSYLNCNWRISRVFDCVVLFLYFSLTLGKIRNQ